MKPFKYQRETTLQPRIKRVLLMIAKGHKEPYIAYDFGLSLKTIGSYMSDMRQYYGLDGTHAEIVSEAMNRGLISEEEMKEAHE